MEIVYFVLFHTVLGKYSEIRMSTAYKCINEWEHYKDFIVDLSVVNSAEDYKNFLSDRDRECGGSGELTLICHSFSNYLFKMHYEYSTYTVDYDSTYCLFCVTFRMAYFV